MTRKLIAPGAIALLLSLAACTNPYDPGQRAIGGGLIGAGAGAAIGGAAAGGTGAAIGAATGGLVGAGVGVATTPAPPPPYYGGPAYYGRHARYHRHSRYWCRHHPNYCHPYR